MRLFFGLFVQWRFIYVCYCLGYVLCVRFVIFVCSSVWDYSFSVDWDDLNPWRTGCMRPANTLYMSCFGVQNSCTLFQKHLALYAKALRNQQP